MKKTNQINTKPEIEPEDIENIETEEKPDYEAEAARCLAVLAENPDDIKTIGDLGAAYYNMQRWADAAANIEKLRLHGKADMGDLLDLTYCYLKLHNRDRIMEMLKEIEFDDDEYELQYYASYFLLSRKEFKALLEMCGKAMKSDSQKVKAIANNILGAYYELQDDDEKAEYYYLEAYKLVQDDFQIVTSIALLYLEQEKFEEAEPLAEKALKLKRDPDARFLRIADAYNEAGMMEKAIPFYKRFLEYEPDDADDYFDLGTCNYHLGKTITAEKLFKKAVELEPENFDVIVEIGDFYGDTVEEYKKAAVYYQKALDIRPDDEDVLIDLADAFCKLNKKKKAGALLDKLSLMDVKTTNTLNIAGLISMLIHKRDKAMVFFEKVLELDPNNETAIECLPQIYDYYGLKQQLLDSTKRAHEALPEDQRIFKNLIATQLNMDEPDKALELAFEALEKWPQSEDFLTLVGNAYANKAEYEKAIEYCNKALEINPDYSRAYHWLGNIYSDMEDHEKAAENNIKALGKDPEDFYSMHNLATDLSDMGRHEEAIELYKKVIKAYPNDPLCYHNIGNVYDDMEDYDNAMKFYRKALKLNPDRWQTLIQVGYIYLQKNRKKKAQECFERAKEIEPDHPSTDYNLACFHAKVNDKVKALISLKTAIEKDSKFIRLAKEDEDFENIRNDPEFITLTKTGKPIEPK